MRPTHAMAVLFNVFWALAALAHQGYGEVVRPSVSVLLTLAAAALLLRPDSTPRLVFLVLAEFVDVAFYLPYVTNHWVLYTLVNLWLALGIGRFALQNKRLPSVSEVYDFHAPGLRILLVVAYLFTALAKVNADFFDPRFGCAGTMLGWLSGKFHLPAPTPLFAVLGAWFTVVIETALPLMLFFRPTRAVAFVAGCMFHVVLGINGFYNFSAVVLALYMPFLRDDFADALHALLRGHPRFGPLFDRLVAVARSARTLAVVGAALLGAAFLPRLAGLDAHRTERACMFAFLALWLASEGVAVASVLWVWRAKRVSPGGAMPVIFGHPALLLPLVILVVDGFAPYLGLKTEGSFTMFSNLRTEGERWNHILLPRAMRIFHYQDDLVTLVDSSDPELENVKEQWTYFTLRTHMKGRENTWVRYRYQGELRETRGEPEPHVGSLPAKLFWFKSVRAPGDNVCTH